MSYVSQLLSAEVSGCLKHREDKDVLRFIICGSGDGKSTLIDRLLHQAGVIEKPLSRHRTGSRTNGEDVAPALRADDLHVQPEPDTTANLASRSFSTDKRTFIIADLPGHESCTSTEVTGASTASLAIILLDARFGVQEQARRQSVICSLLGIKQFVVVVNKMDRVDYSERTFRDIERDYQQFVKKLEVSDVQFVPLSELECVNVIDKSDLLSWYKGQPLLNLLEEAPLDQQNNVATLRFAVQYVDRSNRNSHRYQGTLASGVAKVGSKIKVVPSKKDTTIKQILVGEGEVDEAHPGEWMTLTFSDELDVAPGDTLVAADDDVELTRSMLVDVVWMHQQPLELQKIYLIKVGAAEVSGCVSEIVYQIDVDSLEQCLATSLTRNGIARCKIDLVEPRVIDAYLSSRYTGSVVLIDRLSNTTVGTGTVAKGLDSTNVVWHSMNVDKKARADRFRQKPSIIWFTGLSGSGKSSSADALERQLFAMGYSTYLLDGDNVRHGLCSDLGFSDRDRVENIRRVGELAKLMVDAGHIVLVSFISPFLRERQMVRQMVEPGEFLEVYVNTPLSVCESRDPKGLYKKARAGEIRHFTGIDSPYEPPLNAEIELDASDLTADQISAILLRGLKGYGVIR